MNLQSCHGKRKVYKSEINKLVVIIKLVIVYLMIKNVKKYEGDTKMPHFRAFFDANCLAC